MSDSTRTVGDGDDRTERIEMLRELEDWLQTPMIVLSFFWLTLLIVEFVWGSIRLFETFGTIIWVIFIAEFWFD